jgi:hypothetical protein
MVRHLCQLTVDATTNVKETVAVIKRRLLVVTAATVEAFVFIYQEKLRDKAKIKILQRYTTPSGAFDGILISDIQHRSRRSR